MSCGTGVGKSLFMCHMDPSLTMGKNALYITMEMEEERIAERIDANTLNVPIKELPDMSKKMFDKKIEKLKNKTKGKLIVKEYPTASVMLVTSDTCYKNWISRRISNLILSSLII